MAAIHVSTIEIHGPDLHRIGRIKKSMNLRSKKYVASYLLALHDNATQEQRDKAVLQVVNGSQSKD